MLQLSRDRKSRDASEAGGGADGMQAGLRKIANSSDRQQFLHDQKDRSLQEKGPASREALV
ncbi:hypothetical protein C1J02_12480 [Sulfitobacter sp. SK011]|nr:hypothetical protein C1J02_12480 [Sulfitobacter sp. SK011]